MTQQQKKDSLKKNCLKKNSLNIRVDDQINWNSSYFVQMSGFRLLSNFLLLNWKRKSLNVSFPAKSSVEREPYGSCQREHGGRGDTQTTLETQPRDLRPAGGQNPPISLLNWIWLYLETRLWISLPESPNLSTNVGCHFVKRRMKCANCLQWKRLSSSLQKLLVPILIAGIQETPHSQWDGWPQDFKIKEGHLRHQGHHRDLLLDGLQRLPLRRAYL